MKPEDEFTLILAESILNEMTEIIQQIKLNVKDTSLPVVLKDPYTMIQMIYEYIVYKDSKYQEYILQGMNPIDANNKLRDDLLKMKSDFTMNTDNVIQFKPKDKQ
jgi:hypothetical protein